MDKSSKIIRLVASIFIAIGLWVYVINVVNPSSTTTIRNIPVELKGTEILEEEGLAIEGSGEYTVDITVRAARTDLGTVSADNFTATADVAELTMGQDYITVSVTGPKAYQIEDVRSRKIQVYVDELMKKTIPVTVSYASLPSGYEAAPLSIYPEEIEVKGAKQLVENVAQYVVTLDPSGIHTEDVQEMNEVGNFCNESGAKISGVSTKTENISVKTSVYPVKTVALKVVYAGEPWEGAKINKIDAPTSINVIGPSNSLSKISELSSKEISIDEIYESCEKEIEINLPKGVFLSKENAHPMFKVDVAETGSVVFSYSAADIETSGLDDRYVASYKLKDGAYIDATVTGPVNVLKTLSKSDITLSVDGSAYVEGTKDVKVVASSKASGLNITLSQSQVSVTVKKR